MAQFARIDPVVIEWLYDSVDSARERLEEPVLRGVVSEITYGSRALGRLLITDPAGLDVLDSLDKQPALVEGADELTRWAKLELLRIAARDLCGMDDVYDVGANLAALADDVLRVALDSEGEAASGLAIVAMGKLGGRELNYASDIDVVLVGKAELGVARRVLNVARECFRVDTALRPEGNAGSLVRTLDSYQSYWSQWASPWEFQALLKARASAGTPDLLKAWTANADDALWTRPFGADEIRSVREMKARAESIIERKGLASSEVKRGRGGIRDVEFAVQLLQLVHGRRDASIRSKNTLDALNQLSAGGYIAESDATTLSQSYKFLREVEHRLQLVELEQTHTVPRDTASREHLAQTLHLELAVFDEALREHQATVRHAHERLYFRPLLESFGDKEALDPETVEERLGAFGFTDAERTRIAIKELTRGLARSSRLMQQMMPLLLDWLSTSPDPDEGLLGLRTVISGSRTPSNVVAAFRDSPEVARRMCVLLGTTRIFARSFIRDPELLAEVGHDTFSEAESWNEKVKLALGWRNAPAERRAGLARFNQLERSHIAMFDALNLLPDPEACRHRSELADAVLEEALGQLEPAVPVALIAMGRYGGAELGPGSDLDVIVVHGGDGAGDQHNAELIAQTLLRNVADPSSPNKLYDLDYDLRPEGKQGTLARSIPSAARYYGGWAATWERQALVRARHVAGDSEVAEAFFDVISDFVWSTPPDATQLKEMRHLKARMETERIPRNEDPQFHLKLGSGTLSDIEWTVQLMQLRHGVRSPGTLDALKTLRECDRIDGRDAVVLTDAWKFCQRVRNRLALITGSGGDSLPTDPERLGVLARSLGDTSASLREDFLRHTRRARRITERLFYGVEPS